MNGYELKLESGKWYVGITSKPVAERFYEHLSGNGAEWTKLYKPIEYTEFVLNTKATDWESRRTAELCVIYGIENVRGANFCLINPSSSQLDSQAILIGHLLGIDYNTIRNKLGLRGKEQVQLSAKEGNNGYLFNLFDAGIYMLSTLSESTCNRCGRTGHCNNDCYARTHFSGYAL